MGLRAFYEQNDGWVDVSDYFTRSAAQQRSYSQYLCSQLEHGRILFFSGVPFNLPLSDREFLLSQKQTGSLLHKNISYRPMKDVLRGVVGDSPDRQRLHQIMRHYSLQVTEFLRKFLLPYAGGYQMDYASFRPLEEKGRELPTRKRNDRLHFDSFPSRPTHGDRILRVFTNINPRDERVWMVGAPFHELAPELAEPAGLERFSCSALHRVIHGLKAAAHKAGLPVADHSRYDRFMLHYHDWLKKNEKYQREGRKTRIAFPPGCTWLVYTDGVPHAVLAGRYALEQTYIIPQACLVAPHVSPLRVLEALSGKSLRN